MYALGSWDGVHDCTVYQHTAHAHMHSTLNLYTQLLQHSIEQTMTWGARSIGLILIRRTPPFSDEAFDWAQLNPDESSELIQLIRKKYG